MADYSLLFTLVFCAALVSSLLIRFYLASRQIRHVMQHRHAVPAAFADTIPLAAHQKAADYTTTKARLGLLEMAFGAAVLLSWTLLGGLDALSQAINNSGLASYGSLVPQLALLAMFGLISGLLDLPFTLYSTFKELAKRWRPEVYSAFKKRQSHTALADVHESIDELEHYRTHFLK